MKAAQTAANSSKPEDLRTFADLFRDHALRLLLGEDLGTSTEVDPTLRLEWRLMEVAVLATLWISCMCVLGLHCAGGAAGASDCIHAFLHCVPTYAASLTIDTAGVLSAWEL